MREYCVFKTLCPVSEQGLPNNVRDEQRVLTHQNIIEDTHDEQVCRRRCVVAGPKAKMATKGFRSVASCVLGAWYDWPAGGEARVRPGDHDLLPRVPRLIKQRATHLSMNLKSNTLRRRHACSL